jgi:hypothetical protein
MFRYITMEEMFKRSLFSIAFIFASIISFPQCQVLNRVSPDGSMQYYMEPVNFYRTGTKSLEGCIVTDKESFFLELRPSPFPVKPEGNKLKNDLVMILANGKTYNLKHFDTRYVEADTIMELLYLIDKKDKEEMMKYDVKEVKIDMNGSEGVRNYVFKLHKSALKEQLTCFVKEDEEKGKK